MNAFQALCIASWLISIACAFSLWRRPAGLGHKIIWSVVLLFPVLGPIFYGGFRKVPSIKPADEQGKFDVSRHAGF